MGILSLSKLRSPATRYSSSVGGVKGVATKPATTSTSYKGANYSTSKTKIPGYSGGGESGGGGGGSSNPDMPWLLDEIKKWTAGDYGMSDTVKQGMIDNIRNRLYQDAYGADYNPDSNELRDGGVYGGVYKTMLRDMNRRGIMQSGIPTEEQGKINQAVLNDLGTAQKDLDYQQLTTNNAARQFGVTSGLGYRSGDISLASQAMQQQLQNQNLAWQANQNAMQRELDKYLANQQASAAGSTAAGALAGTAVNAALTAAILMV